MSISTAVSLERISRTVGYAIKKGNFSPSTPYLPQRIAILGEANSANQTTISIDPYEFTSAKEVGDKYGYGSPLHQIARILRPNGSQGVGGIPTIVYPQLSAVGATATVVKVSATGTATKNKTHYLVINGRKSVDGVKYAINVATGDNAAAILTKIVDAITGVLSAPCTAAVNVSDVDITSKWKGVTSDKLTVSFDTDGDDAGITYAEVSKVSGTGAISIDDSLALFGNEWNTIVVNPYIGELATLEQFNGVPGTESSTGRYDGMVFKPFVALFGETESDKDDLATITNDAARIGQVTNVLCPAPSSSGFPWEAAANVCVLLAPVLQNTPHLDVNQKAYPDMPIPSDNNIGDMADYNNRDFLVKKGCSTVMLINGAYVIQDLITTYHPVGEEPAQFRYVRNLNIDWNFRYGYYLLELANVVDHSIAENDQPVRVSGVIKPKQWKQILTSYIDSLASLNLIVEPSFSIATIVVGTSSTNPDRIETSLSYKRSPYARIASTTVEAGFAFGVR